MAQKLWDVLFWLTIVVSKKSLKNISTLAWRSLFSCISAFESLFASISHELSKAFIWLYVSEAYAFSLTNWRSSVLDVVKYIWTYSSSKLNSVTRLPPSIFDLMYAMSLARLNLPSLFHLFTWLILSIISNAIIAPKALRTSLVIKDGIYILLYSVAVMINCRILCV